MHKTLIHGFISQARSGFELVFPLVSPPSPNPPCTQGQVSSFSPSPLLVVVAGIGPDSTSWQMSQPLDLAGNRTDLSVPAIQCMSHFSSCPTYATFKRPSCFLSISPYLLGTSNFVCLPMPGTCLIWCLLLVLPCRSWLLVLMASPSMIQCILSPTKRVQEVAST